MKFDDSFVLSSATGVIVELVNSIQLNCVHCFPQVNFQIRIRVGVPRVVFHHAFILSRLRSSKFQRLFDLALEFRHGLLCSLPPSVLNLMSVGGLKNACRHVRSS